MPLFSYKAKDPSGQIIVGTLEAESVSLVTSRLQAMGYFPVAIENETLRKKSRSSVIRSFRSAEHTSELQ